LFQQRYWSPASWGNIPKLYSSLFADLFVLLLIMLGLIPNRPDRAAERNPGLTRPEWMATSAFSAMPAIVFLLSKYTTGVYVARYTLWAEMGVAVLVMALLSVRARSNTAVGVALFVALMLLISGQQAYTLYRAPVLSASEGVLTALKSLPSGSEPIVVADHHVFMELAYYAPPRIRERLIYPVSRELDLRYFNEDTGALIMVALSHWSKLRIVDYDAVLASHPRFVLAAVAHDYLPWHAVREGYRVVPIGRFNGPLLYEVENSASTQP
jgi:hypothetical protein